MSYEQLYRIQDDVLQTIFAEDTTFYLTGGTCLHRFYSEKRHSDDLDLFTSENALYRDDLRRALGSLDKAGIAYSVSIDTRDFARILVAGELVVDFVNDRVYRHGANVRNIRGYVLDNPVNILANKLCAVIGRDEPKDVFDICTLMQMEDAGYQDILAIARRKCAIDAEELEHRLMSFPVELFSTLAVVDEDFLDRVQREYADLMQKLIAGFA